MAAPAQSIREQRNYRCEDDRMDMKERGKYDDSTRSYRSHLAHDDSRYG
jgi:hypothetical protein